MTISGLEGAYTMRKCLKCEEEFDDSWKVCLYCRKPLVEFTKKASDVSIQKYRPLAYPYKQDKITETIVNVLIGLWQVIKFILIALLCIIAIILGLWLFFGIIKLIFGDND